MSTHVSESQASLLKNVLIITPLSLVGRMGTFLIYVVLANWFGAPAEMDFIYYYWGIAVFLIELLSAASAYSVLVPMLAEARAKSETEARRCVQSIFSRYIVFMPGLCCVLVFVSWVVSQPFLPSTGLSPATTIGLVCGFLCFTIIAAARWMLKAILDTYQAFHLPAIAQGLRAILVIGVIYLCQPFLTWFSIPLALIIGELFQLIVLFWRCYAVLNLSALHLKPSWQTTPYTTQFLRQCLLMMGAAISDGLNPVVDRGMASSLGASSVSKLDYALRLCAIPETLTGVTLPVLLSHWAKISSTDSQSEKRLKTDRESEGFSLGVSPPPTGTQLQRSVGQSVVVLLILMVPFLTCLYLFRVDIVKLLYGHGELSEAGQFHIASLLGIYLLGMLPRLISRLLIRAHLARQAHRTVVTATLIRLILNPFLNWFFMQQWGLEGIAWSTALLSYPILVYIAFMFWRRR
jgi:peptidoglycan biosynthesis protein MviN/MurJ (putative lipid II flippase)